MSRYVLTGASGHIGNNLVRLINRLEPLAEVVTLNRRKITTELIGTKVTQIIGDLNNIDFLRQNITKDDIVIHLACVIDLTNRKRDLMYRTNYLMTKNICDICNSVGVKKFVYIGSVDAIARTGKEDIITEPNHYRPECIKSYYGKTKAVATQYVLNAINEDSNFNCAIVLPSAVVGVNDYKPSAIGKVILNVINNKAEFGIKGGYNFVDVRDVCQAIYTLCNYNDRGQYIVSGHDVSVSELYSMINNCLGVKKKPIIIPLPIVWLCMPFVSVLSPVTVKSLRETHNYSNAKMIDLGVKPRAIEDTFNDTINWFIDNKTLFIDNNY